MERRSTATLPLELIYAILLWLPVKFLLRFRCVSKSFCSIIDNPDFINSHLKKSSQQLNHRKLIFSESSWKEFHVCDIDIDFEKQILLLEKQVTSPCKRVRGYCNGLFLLDRNCHKFEFSLWNPSTQKFRDLPDCPFEVPGDLRWKIVIGLGLSYDDSTNDYKAFCIIRVQKKLEPQLEDQVWIYSLKSNIWRRARDYPYVEYKMDKGFCCCRTPGIGHFTDGSLNWLCSKESKPEIVGFDVRNETFSLFPQPVCSINLVKGVLAELHVLEECLCISYLTQSPTLHAYLYMRKKDGLGKFTWKNLFSITEPIEGFSLGGMEIFGYSKRRDKILLHLYRDGMVWYDLKMKSIEKVDIDIDPKWCYPILCVESLVSV